MIATASPSGGISNAGAEVVGDAVGPDVVVVGPTSVADLAVDRAAPESVASIDSKSLRKSSWARDWSRPVPQSWYATKRRISRPQVTRTRPVAPSTLRIAPR
jgi:hypothetical protein